MKDDHTLLMEAILGSNIPLIQKRLDSGCNINAISKSGESVLQTAVYNLHDYKHKIVLLEYLLDRGADFIILDKDRIGPLSEATYNMDSESLELLLKRGANPNRESGFTTRERLYDEAVWRYVYDHFDCPYPNDIVTPGIDDEHDLWLESLHKLAKDTNNPPPDHLSILRAYGAKFAHEIEALERKRFLDELNPELDVFTIHADEGIGDFLWQKDDGDTSSLVGGALLSIGEKGSFCREMSDELLSDCCNWIEDYMTTCMEDKLKDFNWNHFNETGLSLAQRLKDELGNRARVFYSKAWEDPTDDRKSIEMKATHS